MAGEALVVDPEEVLEVPLDQEVALERALDRRALHREVRWLRGALGAEERPLGQSAAWRQEPPGDLNLRAALNRLERDLVREALRRSAGLRKEAARLLGIDPRNLGYYLRKHRLEPGPGTE